MFIYLDLRKNENRELVIGFVKIEEIGGLIGVILVEWCEERFDERGLS